MAALEDLPGGLDAALAPMDGPIASTFAPDSPTLRWTSPSHPSIPPALPKLQRFLDAIHTHRQKKAV